MTQGAERFPCKWEDLHLDLQHAHRKARRVDSRILQLTGQPGEPIGRFQVEEETLPQKARWRGLDEGIWQPSLASTCVHVPAHVHMTPPYPKSKGLILAKRHPWNSHYYHQGP